MLAAPLLNWPNAVSFARIPLAVAFWLVPAPAVRIGILLVAAATDWFDGWLARRRGGSVPGGEIIDPVFDKLFVLAVITALALENRLGATDVLLILVRDILVVVGGALVLGFGARPRMRARMSGKSVTALQLATLVAAIAWQELVRPLAIVTGAAGAAAAVDYAAAARRSLHRSPPST
jgi:cardiolipin synthase (CMP-forming)